MKRIQSIVAAALAFLLVLLSFAGCKKEEGLNIEEVTVYNAQGQAVGIDRSSVFQLPYTRGDSLNPFFAEMLNNQTLMTLLYESLFTLDETFSPQPTLGESCVTEADTLTVRLRSGGKFSDGTAVGAEDVVYSFGLAKNAPAYQANLSAFSSARAEGDTVVFTLVGSGINADQLLTFPVVKTGTGDTAEEHPVGSGPFVLSAESNGYKMAPNEQYSSAPAITSITLIDAESEEELENALRIGKITFIYNDLSKGSKTSGNSKSTAVPLNNLVFLSFNPKNFTGNSADLRKAVSYGIDREEIASSSYHSFATPAVSIFNPLWKGAAGTEFASQNADEKAAKMALESSLYGGAPLRLLVNEENDYRRSAAELIARQLNALGFHVSVSALPYETYLQYVQAGYYDLLLGEVRLTDDMNLNCFFTPEGQCAFMLDQASSQTAAAYAAYLAGEASLGEFMMACQSEMPLVPVVYRKGAVEYSNQLKVEPKSIYGDIFYNIEEWTF